MTRARMRDVLLRIHIQEYLENFAPYDLCVLGTGKYNLCF